MIHVISRAHDPWREERPVASLVSPVVVLTRGIGLPRVRVARWELGRRRPTLVGTAVHVRVGRRRIVPRTTAVRVLLVATRERVLVHRGRSTARRRTVASSPPVIIIVPTRGRGALTVPIPVLAPTGAVPTRRAAPAVVIWGGVVRTARGARASSVVPGNVRLGLFRVSIEQEKQGSGARTLATQVTRTFLNSRPSNFSTAVLRSAAVSNSTKLN